MKKLRFLLLVLLLAVIFYPAFQWMSQRFLEPDSYYSHGFLIPIVSLFLLWRKSDELKKTPVSSSLVGLFIAIIGLLAYVAGGIVMKIGIVSGISFVIVLFGLVLYLFGTGITRAAAFPLFFLLFMVPLPEIFLLGITFKLKMFAAGLAAALVSSMGIVLQRAGSFIYLPNGVLSVENQCSGINSLISLFTLSVVFAYLAEESLPKRLIFIAASFPIAIMANIFRITFLILAAYVYGPDAATKGILHSGAGMTLWIVALLMLTLLWRLIEWKKAD